MLSRKNMKSTWVVLPCGHVCVGLTDAVNPECLKITVSIGDIGMCQKCGRWWEWKGSSGMIPYKPTAAERRVMARGTQR